MDARHRLARLNVQLRQYWLLTLKQAVNLNVAMRLRTYVHMTEQSFSFAPRSFQNRRPIDSCGKINRLPWIESTKIQTGLSHKPP